MYLQIYSNESGFQLFVQLCSVTAMLWEWRLLNESQKTQKQAIDSGMAISTAAIMKHPPPDMVERNRQKHFQT